MPLPSNENDLKRRARRRLIGAVALTLLAVIVLPLLLEDEPPPASSLAVRMAAAPVNHVEPASQPVGLVKPELAPAPEAPASVEPAASQKPDPKPVPKPEPVKAEPAKPAPKPAPVKSDPPKPAPVKPVEAPQPSTKPAAASDLFVVQLAALSDASKAEALKERAAKTGLPAFTDKVGKLTRVRVGPFPTRAAAVAAAVKLAEHKMAGQVVVQ